jgi:PAS domain-containing protein
MEGGNPLVVIGAAYLHDLDGCEAESGGRKSPDNGKGEGSALVREILERLAVEKEAITEIVDVIRRLHLSRDEKSLNVQILYEADWLARMEEREDREGQDQWEEEIRNKTADLSQSEKRYKELVESAEDLIYSLDRKGRFLSLNNYGAAFLYGTGNKPEVEGHVDQPPQPSGSKAFLGQRIFEVFGISDDFNPLVIEEVWQKGKPRIIEHMLHRADSEHWLHTQLIAIKNDQGGVQAVLGISRNITEKKKIEKFIEEE